MEIKESAYCINEVGVAWYLDEVFSIPIGLPEIEYSDMVGFLDSGYKLRRFDNDGDIAFLFDEAKRILNSGTINTVLLRRRLRN